MNPEDTGNNDSDSDVTFEDDDIRNIGNHDMEYDPEWDDGFSISTNRRRLLQNETILFTLEINISATFSNSQEANDAAQSINLETINEAMVAQGLDPISNLYVSVQDTTRDLCAPCETFEYKSYFQKKCGCAKCGVDELTELYQTCQVGYYPTYICNGTELSDVSSPSCEPFICNRFAIDWQDLLPSSGAADGVCEHVSGMPIDGSIYLQNIIHSPSASLKVFYFQIQIHLTPPAPEYEFDNQMLRKVIINAQPLPPPDGIFFMSSKSKNVSVAIFYIQGRRELISQVNKSWSLDIYSTELSKEIPGFSRVEILPRTVTVPTTTTTPTPLTTTTPPPNTPVSPTPSPPSSLASTLCCSWTVFLTGLYTCYVFMLFI